MVRTNARSTPPGPRVRTGCPRKSSGCCLGPRRHGRPLEYRDPANPLPTNVVRDRPTRSSFAVIAIYIVTKNMTAELHAKGRERLREAGALESAMKLHSCFGEEGQLQVFDVSESQEAFD